MTESCRKAAAQYAERFAPLAPEEQRLLFGEVDFGPLSARPPEGQCDETSAKWILAHPDTPTPRIFWHQWAKEFLAARLLATASSVKMKDRIALARLLERLQAVRWPGIPEAERVALFRQCVSLATDPIVPTEFRSAFARIVHAMGQEILPDVFKNTVNVDRLLIDLQSEHPSVQEIALLLLDATLALTAVPARRGTS